MREGVERRFQELMRAHQHRVTDSRSQTHLQVPRMLTISWLEGLRLSTRLLKVVRSQVACLTVATYNTLLPLLRDRQVYHAHFACYL